MIQPAGKEMIKFMLLFKNNLIALVTYICIALASIPLFFLWGDDTHWYEGLGGGTELIVSIYLWLWVVICTSFSLFLCFLAGTKVLTDTQNKLTNYLSVVAIPITILIYTLIRPYVLGSLIWGASIFPIYPISNTISFFLQIDLNYCYWLMSPVPALIMLRGMNYKKRIREKEESQNLKNMSFLIKNNLIAIVAYVIINLILIPGLVMLLLLYTSLIVGLIEYFHEASHLTLLIDSTAEFAIAVMCTIISLCLFFFTGKRYFTDTHNRLTNLFSVIMIAIISGVTILTIDLELLLSMLPIYIISESISALIPIKPEYVALPISLLPSLMMLLGMYYKKEK